MKSMLSEELITDLVERTRLNMNAVEKLKKLPFSTLNWKENADTWSVLECIEHLNLYGNFYLPEIESKIKNSRYEAETLFKTGLLGNYFAKSMLPKEKLNKMKTFKDKNPSGSKLDTTTLQHFIEQSQKTLEILDRARKVSLNKTKTSISISKWLKLKLGDTFRVIIYHNQRHIAQTSKILNKATSETTLSI